METYFEIFQVVFFFFLLHIKRDIQMETLCCETKYIAVNDVMSWGTAGSSQAGGVQSKQLKQKAEFNNL